MLVVISVNMMKLKAKLKERKNVQTKILLVQLSEEVATNKICFVLVCLFAASARMMMML